MLIKKEITYLPHIGIYKVPLGTIINLVLSIPKALQFSSEYRLP
jgi:hypothetical protein